MFGVDFVKRVEQAEVEDDKKRIGKEEVDISLIGAKEFHKKVERNSNGSYIWNELEKIAEEKARYSHIWSLGELSNVHGYFERQSNAKDVVDFIEKVVVDSIGDDGIDWGGIIKFADYVENERDFEDLCKRIKASGNDLKSRIVRDILVEAIRERKGKIVDRVRGGLRRIDMGKKDLEDRIYSKIGEGKKREEAIEQLNLLWQKTKEAVYDKIPKEKFEVRRLAKEYLAERLSSNEMIRRIGSVVDRRTAEFISRIISKDEVIRKKVAEVEKKFVRVERNVLHNGDVLVRRGEVGELVNEDGDDWTVKFEGPGVVVTSRKSDFDIVSSAKMYKEDFEICADSLDNEDKEVIGSGRCAVCFGDLKKDSGKNIFCKVCGVRYFGKITENEDDGIDDYITVGVAVRVEGDPASPYYGKVGVVEKILEDGWIGINMRDGNYIERFEEDLVPVEKQDYSR